MKVSPVHSFTSGVLRQGIHTWSLFVSFCIFPTVWERQSLWELRGDKLLFG